MAPLRPSQVVVLVALMQVVPAATPPLHAAIPQIEREALVALYDATGGERWKERAGWKGTPGTECTWYGVTCDAGQTAVLRLTLDDNRLEGTIPESLGALSRLEDLNLGSNQLSGMIPPALGNLANLRAMYLLHNQLTGNVPPDLGRLARLQAMYLSFNQLTGDIPPVLGDLAQLQYLYLSHNQFSGDIPASLGKLGQLVDFYLNDNQLTGRIPPELGDLLQLRELHLTSNQLIGGIPAELGRLALLEGLYLDSNELTEEIPRSLGSLTRLRALYLHSNQLAGGIPAELGNLSSLVHLLLGNNQLVGTIPSELGELVELQSMMIYGNQLTGGIPPALGKLKALKNLLLEGNQLTGSIPAELTSLTELQYLHLSFNRLSGSIPESLGNLTQLRSLEISSNELEGGLPAELGSLSNLSRLALDGNQITGNIPAEFSALVSVTDLRLSYNGLTAHDAMTKQWADTRQPGWEQTQTVPPVDVSATASRNPSNLTHSELRVSWLPIPFVGFAGHYEVFIDSGSGFGLAGATQDKAADSLTLLVPGGTYRIRVRTVTDPHVQNQSAVISDPSSVIEAAVCSSTVCPITCESIAITRHPAPVSIDAGQVVTLSVVARGTSPSFQWYVGSSGDRSNPVAGATGSTFVTPALHQTTRYWVEVTNRCSNPVMSEAATVSVAVDCLPVSILLNPSNQTVAPNKSSTLNVAVTGSRPRFQWYVVDASQPASPIAGATAPSFVTPPLSRSGTYQVRVSNDCPSEMASSAATVAVSFKTVCDQIKMTLEPADAFTSKGSAVTLSVVVIGTAPSYQWYRGVTHDASSPIAGANGPSYTTPHLFESAKYWVAVWSSACPGSVFSRTATVTVPGKGRKRAVDLGN